MKQTFGNNLLITAVIVSAFVGFDIQRDNNMHIEVKASEPTPTIVPTPSSTPFVVPNTPKEYIRYIFGETAGAKAITMLETCENKQLRTDAVNWNGNGTTDAGLFQVNSIHGYTHEQLFDFKLNTRIAYKIYKNAGYSFSPWTCSYAVGEKSFWQK